MLTQRACVSHFLTMRLLIPDSFAAAWLPFSLANSIAFSLKVASHACRLDFSILSVNEVEVSAVAVFEFVSKSHSLNDTRA